MYAHNPSATLFTWAQAKAEQDERRGGQLHAGVAKRKSSFVLRRSEVATYLTHSAYPNILLHTTSRKDAETIRCDGIDLDKCCSIARVQGFWMHQGGKHGFSRDEVCEVALDCRNPLPVWQDRCRDTLPDGGECLCDAVHRLKEASGHPASAFDGAGAREIVLASGYDALIVQDTDPDFPTHVVSLRPEQLRIIIG